MGAAAPSFIEEECYPHPAYKYLDYWTLFFMHIGSADNLLACFIWTTEELKTPWRKVLTTPVLIPVYLAVYLVLFPLTISAFLIWLTFQHYKKPYRYAKSTTLPKNKPKAKSTYTFATANICTLPEFLSRFNNNSDNTGRARAVAKRIAKGQQQSSVPPNSKAPVVPEALDHIEHAVLEEFPAIDILLIQEAWMLHLCQDMAEELITVFPHIVYDVGVNSWNSNRYLGNSGLMIASKYPILDVNFNWYRSKHMHDYFSNKGLLQIKVRQIYFV